MRTGDGSGKSRWIARMVVLVLLLVAFWLVLVSIGGPSEPKMIEVDVTDKIAELGAP